MVEFTKVGGRNIGDIKMFTLSTCGWCKKTKALMSRSNVAYSYIDVDLLSPEELEPVRAQQLKYNPSGSYPTIVVDSDYCIIGYDEEQILELIGE